MDPDRGPARSGWTWRLEDQIGHGGCLLSFGSVTHYLDYKMRSCPVYCTEAISTAIGSRIHYWLSPLKSITVRGLSISNHIIPIWSIYRPCCAACCTQLPQTHFMHSKPAGPTTALVLLPEPLGALQHHVALTARHFSVLLRSHQPHRE